MATAAQTNTYLCVLPDKADSNRMAVREQHLADAKGHFANGTLIEGGAFFDQDKATNSDAKMAGSWLLIHAENMDKAREWLMNDIYVKGGAWDPEKFQIYSVARAKH